MSIIHCVNFVTRTSISVQRYKQNNSNNNNNSSITDTYFNTVQSQLVITSHWNLFGVWCKFFPIIYKSYTNHTNILTFTSNQNLLFKDIGIANKGTKANLKIPNTIQRQFPKFSNAADVRACWYVTECYTHKVFHYNNCDRREENANLAPTLQIRNDPHPNLYNQVPSASDTFA